MVSVLALLLGAMGVVVALLSPDDVAAAGKSGRSGEHEEGCEENCERYETAGEFHKDEMGLV
jgi:hypothetical protein